MKQIIIFLLLLIAFFIGYGKYAQYKRFNAPEVNYTTGNKIDVSYHNQEVVYKYTEAIEQLNSFIMMQWTANNIDVRTPEKDNVATKVAVEKYAEKLAKVKFYEGILTNSSNLKEKGLSNTQIQFLEKEGISLSEFEANSKSETIKKLFNENTKLYNGEKNAIVYEVQKALNKKGYAIKIDGVYRFETLNAIKSFEEKNNLLADGYLDVLTLEVLFP